MDSPSSRPKPRPRLRHLAIPRSQVTLTGVTLGNGAYGKVSEVEYDGKLCAVKKVHSILLEEATPTVADKVRMTSKVNAICGAPYVIQTLCCFLEYVIFRVMSPDFLLW